MANNINKKFISTLLPKRTQNSNKSTYGRILNIAGSAFYPGAAYLSSVSALRIGAGYVSLACIPQLINVISSMAPEITYLPLNSSSIGCIDSNNNIKDLSSYNVISLGCGITTNESTKKFILELISLINERQRLIIDADGINIIAMNKSNIYLKSEKVLLNQRYYNI